MEVNYQIPAENSYMINLVHQNLTKIGWLCNDDHSFRSLMACGSSGNLMSFSCCGRFIFFTAVRARVGAAEMPACNRSRKMAFI